MRTLHTKDQNDSSLFEGLKRACAAQTQERRLAEQRRGRRGSRIKGEAARVPGGWRGGAAWPGRGEVRSLQRGLFLRLLGVT